MGWSSSALRLRTGSRGDGFLVLLLPLLLSRGQVQLRAQFRHQPQLLAKPLQLRPLGITVPDPETSKDWGDTKDPGDGAEGWNTKAVRKRPLSGEHQEGRGHKEAPRSPLDNRYGALAGSEEGAEFCTDMDLSLESPLPFPDSWATENILEAVDMDQTPHGVGDVGGAGAH
ncbi:hypothetical protein AAFF_G00040930 [Aldrovandia affinis]|uniref:Uncharacterized protein n=1 Tax=Aldrovandia affinis TaxID=143900 RepID=A0AAD7VXP3_9TELE|nr:hypothetical protein AAFF_G00040930 [Aldrovandia affinis]